MVVALVQTMSNGEQRTQADRYQGTTRKVSPRSTSRIGYFCVCLRCDRTMERCPFKVTADKVVAIREANWNCRPFLIKEDRIGQVGQTTDRMELVGVRTEASHDPLILLATANNNKVRKTMSQIPNHRAQTRDRR